MAIDLEHFPTNETAIRMMERISPIYDRSYVGKWIFEVMGMEMGEARAYFEELRQQPFPERTTWAIEYWERRYAIIPKPTDDLETRRRNIIMKRGARLPMNPARMEQIVDGLTGGTSTVTENVDDYTFQITIDGVALGINMPNVIKKVKKKKPSHQYCKLLVVIHALKPATIHVSGTIGTIACLGLPQGEDEFDFHNILHAGGTGGIHVSAGVHEAGDDFSFRDKISLGGKLSAKERMPVPESTAPPPSTTILRTGGVCTIISNLSKGE